MWLQTQQCCISHWIAWLRIEWLITCLLIWAYCNQVRFLAYSSLSENPFKGRQSCEKEYDENLPYGQRLNCKNLSYSQSHKGLFWKRPIDGSIKRWTKTDLALERKDWKGSERIVIVFLLKNWMQNVWLKVFGDNNINTFLIHLQHNHNKHSLFIGHISCLIIFVWHLFEVRISNQTIIITRWKQNYKAIHQCSRDGRNAVESAVEAGGLQSSHLRCFWHWYISRSHNNGKTIFLFFV